MSDTLLLNTSGQPISSFPVSTINWQRAIKLYFLDKVTVLEWYDDWRVSSPTTTMQVPATVMIKQFQKIDFAVCLNRQNLAMRDENSCAYCGKVHSLNDLTIDHVIPRSKGGKTDWNNCVIACKQCNNNKGSKLWNPRRTPETPTYYQMAALRSRFPFHVKHASWLDYLPNGLLNDSVQVLPHALTDIDSSSLKQVS